VLGQVNIFEAVRRIDLKCRIQLACSSEEYGMVYPDEVPIKETNPLRPLSPYAVSKLGGENYCLAFYESYRLPVAVVRYSNVFGVGQRPDNPYCGVIAKFFANEIRRAGKGRGTAGEDFEIHQGFPGHDAVH